MVLKALQVGPSLRHLPSNGTADVVAWVFLVLASMSAK